MNDAESKLIEGMPFRPYKRFVSQRIPVAELHNHIQKGVLEGGADEMELTANGGREALLASIRRHKPSFDPAEAQTAYAPAWAKLKPILVRSGLSPVDETTTLTDIKAFLDSASVAPAEQPDHGQPATAGQKEAIIPDARNVFVIHGRNMAARNAMFEFLRATGLNPLEWGEAVKMTGKGSPYVGEILDAAFSNAQAIVAILTGDDLAQLRPEFQQPQEPAHEKSPTPQARPNVLFEAGMAFGRHADRTIMVQIGDLRPFSDVAGRHTLHFTGTPENRHDLRDRLITAKCAVKEGGSDWLKAGNFDEAVKLATVRKPPRKQKP